MRDIAAEKSKVFAVKIVNLYKTLCSERKEFVMAKQVLRSGTSIGANLAEAEFAFSTKDYISKKSIALKECAETVYWLELLKETGYIDKKLFALLETECNEILKLLLSTIKTMRSKEKMSNNK